MKKTPNDAKVLLAVARGNEALEKYAAAKDSFDKLKTIDPGLASRYAFLGTGGGDSTRAASAERTKGDVLWQE